MSKYNLILDDRARDAYEPIIQEMFKITPEMMSRKIPRANVQQAFSLETIRGLLSGKSPSESKLLCVGSHEDTCCDSLIKLGYDVVEVEPVKNYDLETYYNLAETAKESFDVVFSVSVIEHVEKDMEFLEQSIDLIKPGGHGVFTMDFCPDRLVRMGGNFQFYNLQDMNERVLPLLESKGCILLDDPDWNCTDPDFEHQGTKYTFATLVFRKDFKQ